MHVHAFPACMCSAPRCLVPGGLEEGIRFCGAGDPDDFDLPCGAEKQTLQEQPEH